MQVYNPMFYMLMNPLDAFDPIKQVQLLMSGDSQMMQVAITNRSIIKQSTTEQDIDEDEANYWAMKQMQEDYESGAWDEWYEAQMQQEQTNYRLRVEKLIELAKDFPGLDVAVDSMAYEEGFDDWGLSGKTFGENAVRPLDLNDPKHAAFIARVSKLDQGLINVPNNTVGGQR